MRLGQTRSPSLAEVLKSAIYQELGNVHTAMPGRIEQYNATTQTANIKPLLKRDVVDDEGNDLDAESLPVLPDVPIIFPRSGDCFLSMPINKGDYVLLIFCEKSVDNYMVGDGEDTDPIDLRQHDLSDAVALPGFAPLSKALKDVSKKDIVLGKDKDGSQIHIKDGGVVEITYASGNSLKIESKDGDATLTVGEGAVSAMIAEAFSIFWETVKDLFDLHGHPSHGAPPASSLPAYDTAITSSKVKFSNG